MCLHVFSPGRRLQIVYGAESVAIWGGGAEHRFELLIANASTEPLDRIHIVYPNTIPIDDVARHRDAWDSELPGSPSFADKTQTFFDQTDEAESYNRFYQVDGAFLIPLKGVGSSKIDVTIPDPSNITLYLIYEGLVKGMMWLTPYEFAPSQRLTTTQWKILTSLGWSVFTVKLESGMEPGEHRWFRFRGRTGITEENDCYLLGERPIRKALGILSDRYEVMGPIDVKHRLVMALRVMGRPAGRSAAYEVTEMEITSLQAKLLNKGLLAADTVTDVLDWRINIFAARYRKVDGPSYWGDVKPIGGLLNTLRSQSGHIWECYQLKAGSRNVAQLHNGLFGIRMKGYDIPLISVLLPWIALVLAAFAFLSRPDVIKWWGKFLR